MFKLLKLSGVPIFEQLQIEEALLRTSSDNWCILNTGSPSAIVMGISGKPEKLLDLEKVSYEKIPVIKRFSGGGTVYIDQQTVFATLICNSAKFNLPLQPKPILEWSEAFYAPLFKGFALRENDYVFGEKKFGGNALYIQKERFLLHTSFFPEKMECLLLPEKRPSYRGLRTHADFLCTLKPYYPEKEALLEAFAEHAQQALVAQPVLGEEIQEYLARPHRKTTIILD